MKRGLIFAFLLMFILMISSAFAYNGFGYEDISITELAQSEWVNAALLFVLIFAVCWWVLQSVFHSSKGAAFVISFVLGLAGSFGTIYYYGAIIPQVGWWVVALFIAVIIAILWHQLKGKGPFFWIALTSLSLLWLLGLRPRLCPYPFPYIVCIILDALMIAIIIFILFKIIFSWIFKSHKKLEERILSRKELERIEAVEKAKKKGEIKALKEEEKRLREIEKRRKKEIEEIEKREKKEREQEQKKVEIRKKERTASELQAKWNHYQKIYKEEWNKYQERARREGLRKGIPPKSSPEGHKRMWALKAMKAIEKMAKQRGIKLRMG